jgi:hypothetical protein
MDKIKLKLIRAADSMPVAPVTVIQSMVNVQVLIYSVGGGLQTGVYSAQGLVCRASKMDGKSGKEWFVCKCARILGVTTMFGSVYNFFCVAILEHGREYTYDENTKMEIFARVLTAVSATRTDNRNLALLWYMLQPGDLLNSFGNERAVIWLALFPSGTKTTVTLPLKGPDDAITMNAKEIVDDTDVVCYVGVVLATSAGNNIDNQLRLIALAEWSGEMWAGPLRVFTDQTAYVVHNRSRVVAETLLKAPLWLAYIEPGTLHPIPSERSHGAIFHRHELRLIVKTMPGEDVPPKWTVAGFHDSAGSDGSNFAGQTLEHSAPPKHGRRRLARARVTTGEYHASEPATDAAGQHVTFWAISNSAVESKRRATLSAQCPGTTISDGDKSNECTNCGEVDWRGTASPTAVRRFAHDASLALLTSETNHMWTDTDPAPTSDNAPGTLDGQALMERGTAVRRLLSATPRPAGVCHISPLRGFQKVDYRGVAPLLTIFRAARRAKCVLRIAGRGLATKEKEPMLQHDKFPPQAPGTTRELSPGSGMRADRHPPNKLTRHFPGRVSTALASASLTGPVNRAVSSVERVGATVRSRTLASSIRSRAGPPTVSLSHCEDSSATLRVVQAGTAAECLPSDLWSCCDTRRRRASDPGVGHVGPVGATMGYVASATPPSTAKPRALHAGCQPRGSDNAAESVPTIIAALRLATMRSSTLKETVLHTHAASFLVMCVVAALSLCPNPAHLAVLCSLLVLTSLMALLGLYEWWCGVGGLADHSGRPRVPTPVSGDRSMGASPERAQNIRPLRVRQQATAVVLNVGRSTGWRREREMSGSPALYSFAVRRLTVLFVLSAIPHTCARADVNLATWTKPGQGLEVWGGTAGDFLGCSVAGVGDVNHDGYGDFVVGASSANPGGRTDAGAAFLVFGSASRSTATIDTLNVILPTGIQISGITGSDNWGYAVSGAGDFNKDGVDDIMIGGYGFDPTSRTDAGAVVVIFGKRTGWADVDLASFTSGSAGFWIYGAAAGDQCGTGVSAASDVNGDGTDDIIVGANSADPQSKSNSGTSYVIFGHSTTTAFNAVDLSTFSSGSSGFKILGSTAGDFSGDRVSGAGDINGDGYKDISISALWFDGPGGVDCGAVYVIFGHSTATAFTDINLALLTSSQGFRITGAVASDRLGWSVSSAGDFNRDGYSDIVIGTQANKAYILFGHSSATAFPNVDLSAFTAGTAGFMVSGIGDLGWGVSGGTDVNMDGIDDVIIAAPTYATTGATYVLYGRSLQAFGNLNVQTGLTTVSGFSILGQAATMESSWSVGLVKDFDGDGVGDLVIGAPRGDPSSRIDAGTAYLVYGDLSTPTSQPSRQPTGQPSRPPTSQPSRQPTSRPSAQPTSQPTSQPSVQPLALPTAQPSRQPTSQPSQQPVASPTSQPSRQPTSQPSRQPTGRPSHRPLSERAGDVNLATWSKPGRGLEVWGASANDQQLGYSVASAGDINMDGYDDVVIGSTECNPGGTIDAGAVFVVFGSGSRSTSVLDTASAISPKGIRISGIGTSDYWGYSVSGAGDFNNDGIADFIIGGRLSDASSRGDAGAAVVIFGKATGWADISLASFTSGSAGFWIYGAASGDQCGSSVSSAGDVNGDGASDVIVGSRYADPFSKANAGAAVVLFGHSPATTFGLIDLSSFASGSAGFRIFGDTAGDESSVSVGKAGDLNRDGYGDILVGAHLFDGAGGRTDSGAAYVIFGHSAATAFTDIDLATLPNSQGFRITGAAANDHLGWSVSTAGDFNHDGYTDMLIGSYSNQVYVLFGQSAAVSFSDIDLAFFTAGTAGFRISGTGVGYSVAGGADINGDGVSDIALGVPISPSPGGVVNVGNTYVLYGRSSAAFVNIDLSQGLPSVSGYRVLGVEGNQYQHSGWSVSLVRDFDGDGVGDLVVGAPYASPGGRYDTGTAYLLYGELSAPTSQPSRQPTGLPSRQPTTQPTGQPASLPSVHPSRQPTVQPSLQPSRQPTSQPSQTPTGQPTCQPSRQPTSQPSVQPVAYPTSQPSRKPTSQPSVQPSRQPSGVPSKQPTSQPSRQPTGRPSHRPLSERSGDVDLATWSKPGKGLEVWGTAPDDRLGSSVTDAGDVNNDGYRDVLVGAYAADFVTDAGAAYLVFGAASRTTSVIDTAVGAMLPKAIKISGATTSDYWGKSVSGAGDFNKDGIDDFIIGADGFDRPSRTDAGAAVVIFGKTSGWADIDLASFTSGSAGFWIWGATAGDHCGGSVSAAGDMNGDGAHDIIVGAFGASPQTKTGAGISYVLFGHNAGTYTATDLSVFNSGSAGFKILGAATGDSSGDKVAGAGDVNGDGYTDVIVGAYAYDGFGGSNCGAAYVIFGHSTATTFTDIDLPLLTNSQGFRITGAAVNDNLGRSISRAGDFNHDGYGDIVLGSSVDKAYILFGHSNATAFPNIDLSAFAAGTAGFMVSGSGNFGVSVGGGVDVNKDGFDDVVIAAPLYAPAGVVYVLFGRSQTQVVNINTLVGSPVVVGYRIIGAAASMSGYWAVALVSDFDGDGVGDVVLGAQQGDPSGLADAGTAYLIYGELSAPTSQPSRQPTGQPSRQPTSQPSGQPLALPTGQPSRQPTCQPTGQPSRQPSSQPTGQPLALPTGQPSCQPTSQPSQQPVALPTSHPSRQPTSQPSVRPTNQPTSQPSRQPTSQPSRQPTGRPSHRPLSQRAGDVNLATWAKPAKGLEVWGAVAQDNAGYSVADAGDVNKDGYHDIIVGAYGVENSATQDAGAVYLVFGSGSRATSTLDTSSTTPQKSIKISGISAADDWGWSVSGAGDFNMDGIDDFMFSSHLFDPSPRVDAGAVVVIFGKTSGWADIDLVSFTSGSAGFWIYGAGDLDHCGTSVAAAGDVNGDGASDVIVGINYADPGPSVNSGMAAVIFGHSAATAFNTISIGTFNSGSAGFKINGATAGDEAGNSVSGAGDVNHDGFSDVIVGAYNYDGPAGDRSNCGAAYVIFGHSTAASFTDINLATLSSSQGFRITGATAGHQVGYSVSSAGDFNHDGYDDIVVGSLADRSYVIFGHASSTPFSTIDLVTFLDGTTRFAIIGTGIGFSVSGGEDVNGDGVSDLIIGAPYTDIPGIGGQAGTAYVLYGRSSAVFTNIDLSQGLPSVSGYRILGGAVSGQVGWSVRLIRDFDGDGVGDLVIGAPQADPSGRTNAGASYVIYGELSAPTSQPSRQPTSQPSRQPTTQPSRQPTGRPSHRPLSQRAGDVDLATWTKPAQGLEVLGTTSYDRAGWSVADAGDINKDGYRDILIGAPIVDI